MPFHFTACQQSPWLNLGYSPSILYTLPIPSSWFSHKRVLAHFVPSLRSYRNLPSEPSSSHLSLIPSPADLFFFAFRNLNTWEVTQKRIPTATFPAFFHFMAGVEQKGAGAWSNMVKREEEEVVVWKREGRKCREWKWAAAAAAGAPLWQIYCEDYGRRRRGHTLC